MDSSVFLKTISATCQEMVADAVNAISVCTNYEDATLIGFMHQHQLLGLRRLMLPLAVQLDASVVAGLVFDRYLSQLEDVKNGSRSLLQTTSVSKKLAVRSTASATV